jgi:hypothetical protein
MADLHFVPSQLVLGLVIRVHMKNSLGKRTSTRSAQISHRLEGRGGASSIATQYNICIST